MNINRVFLPAVIFVFSLFALPDSVLALAKKRGGRGAFAGGSMSVGFGISLITAEQNGLNNLIKAAKLQPGLNVTTSDFGAGYELSGQLTFKFSNGLVGLQIRPAFFTQSATGTGTDGSYNYNLNGYSLFPLVRLIPLSNDIIDFYLQGGLGYATLKGDITNGLRNAAFSSAGFGVQIGLGADFCLVADHCFGIEGNYRYLPLSRNIVSSGTAATPIYGTTQSAPGRELEDTDFNDVATSMSGISGALNYTFNF